MANEKGLLFVAIGHVFRQMLCFLVFLALIWSFPLAGCGGKTTTATTGLSNYPNQIDLEFSGPMAEGIVTGTVTKTEKETNRTFVKIKVNKLEMLNAGQGNTNSVVIPAGMQVVVEVRNPKEEFPEKKEFLGSVRIAKTANGFKLISDNARVQ